MCYRASHDTVVTRWAGDRLLVFSRCAETTHVLSLTAGESLMILLDGDGSGFRVTDVARHWATEDRATPPPDEDVLARLLEQLSEAGIVEQCRDQ